MGSYYDTIRTLPCPWCLFILSVTGSAVLPRNVRVLYDPRQDSVGSYSRSYKESYKIQYRSFRSLQRSFLSLQKSYKKLAKILKDLYWDLKDPVRSSNSFCRIFANFKDSQRSFTTRTLLSRSKRPI